MGHRLTRRELLARASTVAACAPFLGLAACAADAPDVARLEVSGATMGTVWRVKAPRLPDGLDPEVLALGIDEILERVNAQMSTYRFTSELARFNASVSTDWIAVSRDVVSVLDAAIGIGRATNGAFDVTVASLVDDWGFGPPGRRARPPSPERIARLREVVGFQRLGTRSDPPAVRKADPEIRIDLSGIAKGYGLDLIAVCLDTHGVEDYLIEIGGEFRSRGCGAHGDPWRIAIEKPVAGGREALCVVGLSGGGLATSGDYRDFFVDAGVRRSHLIDPRTGVPVAHDLAGVSVVAGSTMEADALATALMVLGPEAGPDLAHERDLAALMVVREGKALREIGTPAFERLRIAPTGGTWRSS